MRLSIDNTRWWETPLAALIFFTRLPFWRLAQPDKSCYRRVVEYWPLAGWLTGGLMAATLYGASLLFPYPIAVVLAIAVSRLYPDIVDYMIFGHSGDEGGHARMLGLLGAKPLLSLGLRLGEGTGALCSFPIIDSAVRMITEMNNFQNANITKYF